jgi:glycosyltransferase involved in cell wall biosynthesis
MTALTIGIPCHNEEAYIGQTIASLVAQDGTSDFDVVISDNASTDGTLSAIEAALEAAPNEFRDRVLVIQQEENIGVHRNYWAVFDAARAPHFMWLGGHDAMTANLVAETLPLITENPEVAMASAQPFGMRDGQNQAFHVPDAVYDFSAPDPFHRYLQSVQKLANCTVFHAIFRKADLADMARLTQGPWDHIVISHLLSKGTLAYSNAGFLRRYFPVQGKAENPIYAKDMAFVDAYLGDFRTVFRDLLPDTLRESFGHLIFLELVNRFGLPATQPRAA